MSKKQTIKVSPSKVGRSRVDVDELRVKIFYDAPKGLNDAQLSKFIGISEAKYYALKAGNMEFLEAIKHYRKVSPLEVYSSFKKACIGYTFDEKVQELQKDKKTGEYKMVVTKIITKHVAPNAAAGYNYLKNQMPDEFKDKIEQEHTFKGVLENITFIIEGNSEKK